MPGAPAAVKPPAAKPAAASGTRTSSSSSGVKAAKADSGLLGERARYWRSEGLSDAEVRRELRDEGFTSSDIAGAVGSSKSSDADSRSEPPPAPSSPGAGGRRSSRSGSSSSGRSVGLGPLQIRTPGTPAGMMLAIVAYPAILAYLTGGPTQLKAWFRAKFLNQTSTDAGIRNEAFASVAQLLGTGVGGGSTTVTPTAALSSYGRPRPSAPPAAAPKGNAGSHLPAITNQPNAYSAITGTWGGDSAKNPGTSKGAGAVAFARSQLGDPYKYGGTGPDRWDCSGLAQAAWRSVGVKIPRTTAQQIFTGRRVAKKHLAPGDLVFPATGHVQIYAGGGQVIEAPRTGLKVRVAPLGSVLTARRPG